MGKNVVVLLLITAILGLAISLYSSYDMNEQAFTPDNFIRYGLVERQ